MVLPAFLSLPQHTLNSTNATPAATTADTTATMMMVVESLPGSTGTGEVTTEQASQGPPQSAPDSSPFCTPSKQDAGATGTHLADEPEPIITKPLAQPSHASPA